MGKEDFVAYADGKGRDVGTDVTGAMYAPDTDTDTDTDTIGTTIDPTNGWCAGIGLSGVFGTGEPIAAHGERAAWRGVPSPGTPSADTDSDMHRSQRTSMHTDGDADINSVPQGSTTSVVRRIAHRPVGWKVGVLGRLVQHVDVIPANVVPQGQRRRETLHPTPRNAEKAQGRVRETTPRRGVVI